jgi:putative dimethyl sulfoxide reductase chaperone
LGAPLRVIIGEVVESIESVEIAELINNRIKTYGLLSRLFRVEVDDELLQKLKQMSFDVKIDDVRVAEGYRIWNECLAKADSNTLLNLAIDYARAFIGSGNTSNGAAYPYESVYTSPKRLIMQDARDQVLEIYRSEELGKLNFNEPEDHIALELEFMVHMNLKLAQQLNASDITAALENLRKQQAFLTQHLLNWVPMFAKDIIKYARAGFYCGLAEVTAGFLELDRQVNDDLIAELE